MLSQSNSPAHLASRTQIDKIGKQYVASPSSAKEQAKIQDYRAFRLACLTTSLSIIVKAKFPEHALLSIRLKRLQSIQRKITRSSTNLSQMDDIIGFRIVCRSYSDAEKLSTRMALIPNHVRVKNYALRPRDTGYRAWHHIFGFKQKLPGIDKLLRVSFEVQVRTYYQHMWATHSESYGEQVKEGSGSEAIKADLLAMTDQIAGFEDQFPQAQQSTFPRIGNVYHLAVVVRRHSENDPPQIFPLGQNHERALMLLHYFESSPRFSKNTLLLAGVSGESDAERVLRLTHPWFFNERVSLETWMPQV